MSINGVGIHTSGMVQSLLDMRARLADLQRQLGTGKRADTYAGVGLDRGLTVGLRSQLAAISSYTASMTTVGVRIDLMQAALSRVSEIGHELKGATVKAPFDVDSSGQGMLQRTATANLGEMLGVLNTRAGDRYIFSGRAVDQPSVESLQHILEGDGARAGLKQLISERNQADLGSTGLGRLVVSSPSASAVEIAEDAPGSVFGFKLAAISSDTGATLTGPAGSPPAVSVDFGTTNPTPGQKITLTLTLPDGSTEALTLTAAASATPGPNEFTVGASVAATATNLQAAIPNALGTLARTALSAASALAASNDFFNTDGAHPPRRVDGPPFDSATALIAGTPANTVAWYTGDNATDSARGTATARIDDTIGVSYGARANEESVRWMVQNVAVLAATTFSPSDPNAAARFAALKTRITPALDTPTGVEKIENIQTDLAGVQASMESAKARHQQTGSTLAGLLEKTEGVSVEEVASQILALQIKLQASMQTTAMLYQTSLVNYL